MKIENIKPGRKELIEKIIKLEDKVFYKGNNAGFFQKFKTNGNLELLKKDFYGDGRGYHEPDQFIEVAIDEVVKIVRGVCIRTDRKDKNAKQIFEAPKPVAPRRKFIKIVGIDGAIGYEEK